MKLIAEAISCHRGSRAVIENLSFTLSGGEALLLRGPNGAGKTTLLRSLAGFLPILKGRLWLQIDDASASGTSPGTATDDAPQDRQDQDGEPPEISEYCHYVGHLNGIKHGMTATENLQFWQHYLSGRHDPDSIAKALDAFDLTELAEIPAGLMSQGQKRRLGLARLLIAKRMIWILDEPTVSLDTHSQTVLANHVAAHVKNGGMVIAATHIPLGLAFSQTIELAPRRVAA